jgi:hypothetical protein
MQVGSTRLIIVDLQSVAQWCRIHWRAGLIVGRYATLASGIMKRGFSLAFRLETPKRSLIDLYGPWAHIRYPSQLLRRKSRQSLLAWCLMFVGWNTIEDILTKSRVRELPGYI